MTIETIDREAAATLRADITAALAEVAKKHGVTIQLGNGRFTEQDINFKLHVGVGDRSLKDKKAERNQAMLHIYGRFDSSATYEWLGKKYKLVGYNTRARSMPYQLTEIATGKGVKCSDDLLSKMKQIPA